MNDNVLKPAEVTFADDIFEELPLHAEEYSSQKLADTEVILASDHKSEATVANAREIKVQIKEIKAGLNQITYWLKDIAHLLGNDGEPEILAKKSSPGRPTRTPPKVKAEPKPKKEKAKQKVKKKAAVKSKNKKDISKPVAKSSKKVSKKKKKSRR